MEIEFSNEQIDTNTLPHVEDIEFIGLNKEYLRVGIISSALFWLVIFIVVVVITMVKSHEFPAWLIYLIYAMLAGLIALSFSIQILGFKRKKYALRERDILFRQGLLWRSYVIIPFNRIQHAEVYQGPLERIFDLSNLRIYTAGGSSSDLSIPGLLPDEANRMKHYIISKTSADEEE